MAVSRTVSLRSCFRLARPVVARPIHQTARRQYSSGQHAQPNTGSDAMWAAGAVLVTIPSCWYLLSNKPKTSNHNHHDEEDTEVVTSEEETEKDVESESAEEESRKAHESGIEADKPESIETEKPNHVNDEYDTSIQTPTKVNTDGREGIKHKSDTLTDEENSTLKNETDEDTSISAAQELSNMNEISDHIKENDTQLAETKPKSADDSD
ncbi:unnamed protein product [Blumeria hordei]|uniref:Uncharacterized protein n=1 Tax=Blumeria hordei TaxID=2867405 RepID=A0A383URP2_BLUHO|nr:unnamed protein product [Blumeria hordei]